MFGMMPEDISPPHNYSGLVENIEPPRNTNENHCDEPFLKSLEEAIKKVNAMEWIPSAFVYNIESHTQSVDAVDINHDDSLLALSFRESPDIYVKIKNEEIVLPNERLSMGRESNVLKFVEDWNKKRSITHSSDRYLRGHSKPVTGMKFIMEANLLLSCSRDGFVIAWDTENFTKACSFYASKDFLYDIDVSSLSSHFATVGANGIVKLFALDGQVPVHNFSGDVHDDFTVVKFHPNGYYLAAAADNKINLWNIRTRNVSRTIVDDDYIRSIAFSSDGRCLASYSGGCIKIWDLASGRLLTTIPYSDDKNSLGKICFSDKHGVLSCGCGTNVKLWNIENLQSDLDVHKESSADSKVKLLQSQTLPGEIKLIKFDERNYFKYVTQTELQLNDPETQINEQSQSSSERPQKGLLLARVKGFRRNKKRTMI